MNTSLTSSSSSSPSSSEFILIQKKTFVRPSVRSDRTHRIKIVELLSVSYTANLPKTTRSSVFDQKWVKRERECWFKQNSITKALVCVCKRAKKKKKKEFETLLYFVVDASQKHIHHKSARSIDWLLPKRKTKTEKKKKKKKTAK